MSKFFISDCHFGHSKLIEKMGRKGFTDIEEHDQTLIENINSKVNKTEQLYILGDFGELRRRSEIRCKHIFYILGNHDKRTHCERTFGRQQVTSDKLIKFGDTKAFLYHYPIAFWNGSHHGFYHFYGHTHGQREITLDSIWPDRRSMEVSVDTAQYWLGRAEPFSEDELLGILSDRSGHDPVSFYKELQNDRAS